MNDTKQEVKAAFICIGAFIVGLICMWQLTG